MDESTDPLKHPINQGKAFIHIGATKLDMSLIVPKWVSDDDVMHSTVPVHSAYRAEMQKTGRVGIPKSVREGLGLAAGDEVDIIVIPVRKVDKK